MKQMNKDLLDEITDIEVLKDGYRSLNKLIMIKESKLDKQQQEIERLTFESTKWESKFYDEAKKVDKAIECIEKSWNDKCTIPLEEVGYSTDDRWEIWKILKGNDKE